MERFEYRGLMTHFDKISRDCEAGRPRANNGYLLASWRSQFRDRQIPLCCFPIGHETLQPAYGDRFEALRQSAYLLALLFLRAYSAGDRGESIGILDLVDRSAEISFRDKLHEIGYVNVDRTTGNAIMLGTLQASLSISYCLLGFVAVWNLVEVLDTLG
jgi:hypothetical protein